MSKMCNTIHCAIQYTVDLINNNITGMRSAKRTTLCRALQSWFVALLYHTEMH